LRYFIVYNKKLFYEAQLFINTLFLFEIKIRINFEINFVLHIEVMTHVCNSIIYNSTRLVGLQTLNYVFLLSTPKLIWLQQSGGSKSEI